MLAIQNLASKLGKLNREYESASPSRRVILQIEMQALKDQMSLESRSLKKREWVM